MRLSTAEAVQEMHRVALQQTLTRALKTDRDWAQFNAIARGAATRVDAEKADFRHDYQVRLAEARQAVLREQNTRALELRAPGGSTPAPPSPEKIDVLATNRVQADHERRIAAIRQDEVDAYRGLGADIKARDAEQARARETRSGHARDAFNLTNQISPDVAKSRGRSGPSRS
ncbi:MAG: hypothetical protein AAGK02_00760 [Pseudomonadota bacterium]